EPVINVFANVATDFALIGTGIAGGHIGAPTTSDGGMKLSIPVTGLRAEVTVDLNLTHTKVTQDLPAKPLSTATRTSQTYTLSHTVPSNVMKASVINITKTVELLPSSPVLALAPDSSSSEVSEVFSQAASRLLSSASTASSKKAAPSLAELDDF